MDVLFRWDHGQSDALNRARRHYADTSFKLYQARRNQAHGMLGHWRVQSLEHEVCDALDRLAGAQERERMTDTGGAAWHTKLAHKLIAEGHY